MAGNVDYRLARNVVVSEYRKGHLSRLDVCDAHPELLRAAADAGEDSPEDCPICEEVKLRLVSYVFGHRLPASGPLRGVQKGAGRLATPGKDLACYVVEVCPGCSWNHLAHSAFSFRAVSALRDWPTGGPTGSPVGASIAEWPVATGRDQRN